MMEPVLAFPAKTVYVDAAVRQQANTRRRLERILPHVRCDDVREYDAAARQDIQRLGKRRHGKDDFGDDAVVAFTTFDPARLNWYYHLRDGADEGQSHGGQCQTALELNIVDGCVFRCAYCGFGRSIVFYLDIERFLDGLGEVFARHPSQRLYKYSNMTDLPPFEPELDALPPLVQRFAREEDRYLMVFTKSDNVGFLKDLDHRGHTVISWSLTCDSASRLVDKRTPTMDERIGAMGSMQQAGYRVRARLSPVVPVRNWREEYTRLFETLFRRVRPDVVTLELLGWMDVGDLLAIFDSPLLDPAAVQAAQDAREQLRGVHWGPFTQATHEEVYRFCIETVRRLSPETPVSVCHGTPATWNALGPLMRMTPNAFICNCGPQSAPGGEVYDRWHPRCRPCSER
ncbi:MAG: radical SAM protein [Planctomycetota bacterium]|nr:radical SAM protein [Planctomycetota bacterium]